MKEPDGSMDETIRIVPAIKRLSLRNIGVWKDLQVEFSDQINVITGENGTGKTTILDSILSRECELLASRYLDNNYGSIEIEFFETLSEIVLDEYPKDVNYQRYATGEKYLSDLKESIGRTSRGAGLLLDDFGSRLDMEKRGIAVSMLTESKCQVVCVVHQMLEDEFFGQTESARIFEAVIDPSSVTSQLFLRYDRKH